MPQKIYMQFNNVFVIKNDFIKNHFNKSLINNKNVVNKSYPLKKPNLFLYSTMSDIMSSKPRGCSVCGGR